MRAVVTRLLATGILLKVPTNPLDWEQDGPIMCYLRHPQNRWDDRRIQPRPDHSAGVNSERETEDASPSSNTPRFETTPTYGITRSDATPTPGAPPPRTRTKKQRDPGTPEPMFPTQETARSAETALSQGEYQGHTHLRCNGSQTCSTNRRNS